MLTLVTLIVVVPLVTAGVLAVVWPLRHTGRLAGVISSLAALVSFGASVLLYQRAPAPSEGAWTVTMSWLTHGGRSIADIGARVDHISAPMLVVVTLVAAMVQIYSLGYLADEPKPALGRYFTWHSLFIFSMTGLVLAPNLLQALACWELVGLCSYLLIGFYWAKPSAAKAAVKAVWVTRFADIGLMLGVVMLYAKTGGFSWEANLDGAATAIAALIFLGVMGKSAQVPLHVWLPDAMEGPTPVSALLHAATMVAAGVFLVVRTWPIFEAAPSVLEVMTWVGAITAIVAACTALVQNDIKKVLAYSTCSQLGYMVAGLGSGSMLGGYWHLTTHAFFKALLFLGAGSVIHAVHSNDLRDMGGLLKKTPMTAGLFVLGALALAGIPPFSGFFSKDLILEELVHAGAWGPVGLLVISAGLTAFYMTRVICLAFLGRPGHHAEHAHESPFIMVGPMVPLMVLAVSAGAYSWTFAERVAGEAYHFALTPVGIAALVVGLSGIGLGYAKYGLGQLQGLGSAAAADFIRSGPVDRFWAGAWARGLLPFARVMGFIDRYVVDGLVNLFGIAALEGGETLRTVQSGRIRDYLTAVVVGALLFVAWGAVWGAGA